MKRRAKPRNKFTILSILMLITMLLVWGCGGNGDVEEPQGEEPSQGEETPTEPDVEEPEQEEEAEEGEEAEEQDGLSNEELADLFTSGKDMDEFFYEMKISGMGEADSTTGFYIKGKLMRMESEVMGQKFIMISDEDAFYTLDPQSKTAMKMPLDMEAEEEGETPTLDDFTDDVDKSNMNYIGKETINGVSCHVVESKDLNTDYEVKMWLHEEYGFPMRIETKMEEDKVFISEVTDFKVGNISDELFEIPEDYEVMDLGSMIPATP